MRGFLKYFAWFVAVVLVLAFWNLIMNLTVYNPAVAVPAFRWLKDHKLIAVYQKVAGWLELSERKYMYPTVSVGRLENSLFFEPRAAVIGTVTYTAKSIDGDWHINVQADGYQDKTLVTEIIPELPLPVPPVGARIKIWGVTRYDLEHRWWELHPVIGWEIAK